MDDRARDFNEYYEELRDERRKHEGHWRDIVKYISPDRLMFGAPESCRRMQGVYDSTAILASERLAAVTQSMLTNLQMQWMLVQAEDEGIMKSVHAKKFFELLSKGMDVRIRRSNFATASDEWYKDTHDFGTGVLLLEPGDFYELNFQALPLDMVLLDESPEGYVDTLYHTVKMSASKILAKFPKRSTIPDWLTKLAEEKPREKIMVCHKIAPRSNAGSRRGSRSLPYESVWAVGKGDSDGGFEIVWESGYHEQPFCAVRWRKLAGNVYGRGIGTTALPDIKSLNFLQRDVLKAVRRVVDPAYDIEDNSYMTQLDMSPNAVNVRKQGSAPAQPMVAIGNIPIGEHEKMALGERVKEAFYERQLQLVDLDRMTATEVIQRSRENMQILGPNFGRYITEAFPVIARRIYGIMTRLGSVPPMPEELRGQRWKIKYTSPLARAQQVAELEGLNTAALMLQPFVQMSGPDMLDWINTDDIGKVILELNNVRASAMRTEQEVARIREARQAAMEQAEQQQQIQQGLSMVNDLARGLPNA